MTSSSPSVSASPLDCSHFTHTPYYCEENVYMLCKTLCSSNVAEQEGSDLFVIFISNEYRQVPLWCQKASREAGHLVIWDYHVICIQKATDKNKIVLVWDLDTALQFPISLHEYITEAIKPSMPLHQNFRRLFRIVHAPIYLRSFASDRRHMRDADGNWKAPPPPYNCITSYDGFVHNLESFISIASEEISSSMQEERHNVYHKKFGIVVDENNLEDFFGNL